MSFCRSAFMGLGLAFSLGAASGPLSPREALQSFQIEPGLVIELAAAEPSVVDPVAMAFDQRGHLFVAENAGYPTSTNREGRVIRLIDGDGDGYYEQRSLFASDLAFPNGLMPWRGGLFVTDAPDLLYLKDTDQDGRADLKHVVLTGFSTQGSTQLRVNDPTLALDGWIYLAGGLSQGKITSPQHPDHPAVDLARHDLRFQPHTGEFEPVDGKSQFGLAFDTFGRRFICMNRVQAQHVVLESRYLQRNPHLGFSRSVQDLPEDRVDDLIRGNAPAAARLYPLSDNITTADSHAGTFSAACAVTVWRGGALPDAYDGRVFSCDPTANLVHWDDLIPAGATFRARRSPAPVEFVASTDNWFRPVYLAEGPDGALYICDMYRKTIEHPDYLPVEVRKRTDFNSGKEAGRIWRIIAAKGRVAAPDPLGTRPGSLVAGLNNLNSWQRQTAFRLLWEERQALPNLRLNLTNGSPQGRVATLALLNLFEALSDSDLLRSLRDPEPGVREFALRLCESRSTLEPDLSEQIVERAGDPDARVRFQCALTLGELRNPGWLTALARILRADPSDAWLRAAVYSSAGSQWPEFFSQLLSDAPDVSASGWARALNEAARITQAPAGWKLSPQLASRILDPTGPENAAWQIALLSGLAPAHSLEPDQWDLNAAHLKRFRQLVGLATDRASDPDILIDDRLLAIELLGAAGQGQATLVQLLRPTEPEQIQLAALRALHRLDATARWLFEAGTWRNLSFAAREGSVSQLLERPQTVALLLDALEKTDLNTSAITPQHRQRLLRHPDAGLRSRAEQLFQPLQDDRQTVLEQHKRAVTLASEVEAGRRIFEERCASCHRLDRIGQAVGPDLFGMRNQEKEVLLLHIIVPNHEIAPGFEACTVELNDERSLTGLIGSQSATSLTLRQALGLETTFARTEIVNLQPSEISYMPEGLEYGLTDQDLANLLGYLKGE